MSLGVLTVTYFPDLGILRRQLQSLPGDVLPLVVDNSADAGIASDLASLLREFPGSRLLVNGSNLGLAQAVNLGADQLRSAGCDELLLLDQDTEPERDAVLRLRERLIELHRHDERVLAVGPRLRDPDSGVEHGFHCMRGGFWTRQIPEPGSHEAVVVDSLNGSGTMTRLESFCALGGLDRSLFIDHVDTEWSFRVRAEGYRLLGVPEVRFAHRMGQLTTRIWLLGWRPWPLRSPERHRNLFRNSLWLMRRAYVPRAWKFWAIIKLLLTAIVTAVIGPDRRSQVKAMAGGLAAGLRAQAGVPTVPGFRAAARAPEDT